MLNFVNQVNGGNGGFISKTYVIITTVGSSGVVFPFAWIVQGCKKCVYVELANNTQMKATLTVVSQVDQYQITPNIHCKIDTSIYKTVSDNSQHPTIHYKLK